MALLLLLPIILPAARAFAPVIAAPPSSSRWRRIAGLSGLPGSSSSRGTTTATARLICVMSNPAAAHPSPSEPNQTTALLAPLRAMALSGGMEPDDHDDPSPPENGGDASADATGAAAGAFSPDYNQQQRGGHHWDDRLLHRRRPRVPFSQRRGGSWGSAGRGGGGGNGEGGSSPRRGDDGGGGGERERDRENKGRVFRGVRTSFSEVDEAGRFVRRYGRVSLCVL